MKIFAQEFHDLHQIPYVVWAVDRSHIPIIAPRLHEADYYNRKGFHSIMLRVLYPTNVCFEISTKARAESIHDVNLWAKTDIGHYSEADKLSPYALVGDTAYSCRPWMLAPFKGHKDRLYQEEYHWNFVQSLTHMCIERALRMLKGRWRI
jgi:hypothetical protein